MDDDIRSKFQSVTKSRAVDAIASAERHNAATRQRLAKIIKKKTTTSFIGALARFEDYFGWLWGIGGDSRLTSDQEQFRADWDECRQSILNNGNDQIRALESELQLYEVSWLGYQNHIEVVQPRGNQA